MCTPADKTMKWFKRSARALVIFISLAVAVLDVWSTLLIGKKYPAELEALYAYFSSR
jgi:autotransporter translocation and assembly factor TamB